MGTWIDKFRSLRRGVKPYAIQVAAFACKNLGVPGGGVIAEALEALDRVQRDRDLEHVESVLEVVLDQAETIIQVLEAEAVPIQSVAARLAGMSGSERFVQLTLQRVVDSLRAIPDIVGFLQQDIAEVLTEVRVVGAKVDELRHDVHTMAQALAHQQREMIRLLEDVRAQLSNTRSSAPQIPLADSASVRTDADRALVAQVLERIETLPPSARNDALGVLLERVQKPGAEHRLRSFGDVLDALAAQPDGSWVIPPAEPLAAPDLPEREASQQSPRQTSPDPVELQRRLQEVTAAEDWKAALELLETLGDLETEALPQADYAWRSALIALDHLDDQQRALQHLDTCLDAQPQRADAFARARDLLRAETDWAGLRRAYRLQLQRLARVRMGPDRQIAESNLWFELGELLERHLEKPHKALEAYQKAAQRAPSDTEIQNAIGDLLLRMSGA